MSRFEFHEEVPRDFPATFTKPPGVCPQPSLDMRLQSFSKRLVILENVFSVNYIVAAQGDCSSLLTVRFFRPSFQNRRSPCSVSMPKFNESTLAHKGESNRKTKHHEEKKNVYWYFLYFEANWRVHS